MKLKTIEEIIENEYCSVGAIVTIWKTYGLGKNYNSMLSNPLRSEVAKLLENVAQQIKQLIADELELTEQQRKKLERL